MTSLDIQPGTAVTLASPGQTPEQVHIFESQSILAVNAALAARRPLLVRGEPGIGKSQLARAAAKALDRASSPSWLMPAPNRATCCIASMPSPAWRKPSCEARFNRRTPASRTV